MQDGEEDFYQQYLEGHKNHIDLEDNENDNNDQDEEEEDDEDEEGMDYSQYLSTLNSMNRGGFNYPGTFEHNGELAALCFFFELYPLRYRDVSLCTFFLVRIFIVVLTISPSFLLYCIQANCTKATWATVGCNCTTTARTRGTALTCRTYKRALLADPAVAV